MPEKTKVSVIIVKYRCDSYLKTCTASLDKRSSGEIIIVDNDLGNIGFGAGCNKGAKRARSEYLLFLNPDTIVLPGAIDSLTETLEGSKDTAIVAPLLLDRTKKPYLFQGTTTLTPFKAIFSLSFLNKYWPTNPVSVNYWLKEWDKKGLKAVDVVPGSAFMIRKDVFEKIGGFDEKIFLYFEEFDLCKRVRDQNWQILINSQSQIIHFWDSPIGQKDAKAIFKQSRFYYFKKHFGIFPALLVESFLRSSEWLAEKI